MEFWKFISQNNKSLNAHGEPIEYIVGGTIEIENYNPDKETQCAAGIHCLAFSDKKYDAHNVIFGPKVAILEVEEEDIVYFEEKGKCRVRKAKVLEIKEPEDWMETGNGNAYWAYNYSLTIWKHKDYILDCILKDKHFLSGCLLKYAKYVLGEYDKKVYDVLETKNPCCAYDYKKYFGKTTREEDARYNFNSNFTYFLTMTLTSTSGSYSF